MALVFSLYWPGDRPLRVLCRGMTLHALGANIVRLNNYVLLNICWLKHQAYGFYTNSQINEIILIAVDLTML